MGQALTSIPGPKASIPRALVRPREGTLVASRYGSQSALPAAAVDFSGIDVHRPRSAGPPLSSAGYHRVFKVLECCDGATSVVELAHRLVVVLPEVYRCRIATFFTGRTLTSAIEDPEPMVVAPIGTEAVWSEYRRRWRSSDVYGCPSAQEQLMGSGVAVLRYLDGIPSESLRYVRDFLNARGIAGSAAMRLTLPGGDVGLVGMFDDEVDCFSHEDARGLALLSGRLSAIARWLPSRMPDDILAGIAGSCREVALLVGEGMTNAAIANRLCLAEDTVKKYVSRVLATTGCRSRTELAIRVHERANHGVDLRGVQSTPV